MLPNDVAVLRRGDAFALLAELRDGAVEHVVCDPPYADRTHKGARSCNRVDSPIDFPPFSEADVHVLVTEALRVASRWVLVFCDLERFGLYQAAAGACWIRAGLWIKPDGTPQLTGDRPAQAAEGIAIMHRPGAKRWNRHGARGIWTVGKEREERIHPTQKPVQLMVELLAAFTEPGELVVDPFAGSATTAVACLRTGRLFYGCELDPVMWQKAQERIDAEAAGTSLGAALVRPGRQLRASR